MELLERDSEMAMLEAALDEAGRGRGRVVVIRGEAGIGKTSLVRSFVAEQTNRWSALWGACDDLLTPRPLGPILDIATDEPDLAAAVEAGQPTTLFAAVLAVFDRRLRPTLMVIEDIHWADAATLDVLRYVGRRMTTTRGLLIVTFRTLDVDKGQLIQTIAALPADSTVRVELKPLTADAVNELANRAGKSAPALHADSGGNPFFVTEMLATDEGRLPASVLDSVLSRAAGLGPNARRLTELVSVVPGRMERRLLEKIVGPNLDDLTEAEQRGLLVATETEVAFRHEVARRAMEASLPGGRRQALNQTVLEALVTSDSAPARLVHHALAAGDSAAVARYAPAAARQAAALASHREAVENYRLLSELLVEIDTPERAGILADWAWEEWTMGGAEAAQERALQAAGLWRDLSNSTGVSRAMRIVAQARWGLADIPGAEAAARETVDVLDADAPSPELAAGLAIQSWLAMLRNDQERTVALADRAIEVSRVVGAKQMEVHALNNKGVVMAYSDFSTGVGLLEESYDIARANGFDQDAIRAAANLADTYHQKRQLDGLERWTTEATRLIEESASARFDLHVTGLRAELHLLRGEWDLAARLATAALGPIYVAPDRPVPLKVLGLLAARRGDPSALPMLEEAAKIARDLDSFERLCPVLAALAEAAFMAGDPASIPPLLSEAYEQARRHRYDWTASELGYWLWKADALEGLPAEYDNPYRQQTLGEWAQAADHWSALGLPYQQAMALAEGDLTGQFEALAIFDHLGATVTAGLLRRQLHLRGVVRVPRGPNKATRADGAGLTSRHREVLELMADGYSNAEIAARIFISPKTVEHHVSAILATLGASNRREAVRVAKERGILNRSEI